MSTPSDETGPIRADVPADYWPKLAKRITGKEADELRAEVARLRADLREIDETTSKDYAELDTALGSAQAENARLKAALADERAERERQQVRATAAEGERNVAQESVVRLKAELERITAGWREAFNVGIAHQERAESLKAELETAKQNESAIRELMNWYNLGGWTDAESAMKRALAAECRAESMAAQLRNLLALIDSGALVHNPVAHPAPMQEIHAARAALQPREPQ